eukprot:g2646.t1
MESAGERRKKLGQQIARAVLSNQFENLDFDDEYAISGSSSWESDVTNESKLLQQPLSAKLHRPLQLRAFGNESVKNELLQDGKDSSEIGKDSDSRLTDIGKDSDSRFRSICIPNDDWVHPREILPIPLQEESEIQKLVLMMLGRREKIEETVHFEEVKRVEEDGDFEAAFQRRWGTMTRMLDSAKTSSVESCLEGQVGQKIAEILSALFEDETFHNIVKNKVISEMNK